MTFGQVSSADDAQFSSRNRHPTRFTLHYSSGEKTKAREKPVDGRGTRQPITCGSADSGVGRGVARLVEWRFGDSRPATDGSSARGGLFIERFRDLR